MCKGECVLIRGLLLVLYMDGLGRAGGGGGGALPFSGKLEYFVRKSGGKDSPF